MTATAAGPAAWPVNQDNGDVGRMEKIKQDLGAELVTISQWCGERTREGDDRSVLLLVEHFQAIVAACAEVRVQNRKRH